MALSAPEVYVPGLIAPLPRPLLRGLRSAVLDFREQEHRKHHDPVLHVGWPRGARATFDVRRSEALDVAVRTDVVKAMCRAHSDDERLLVWLTRLGDLSPQDVDGEWLSAVVQAAAEMQRPMTMVVVARPGWRDPLSGLQQEWARLRDRRTHRL